MRTIVAFALPLVYFACVIACVPLAGPRLAPWLLSALSVAFAWCFLTFTRGSAGVAVAIVIVVTLVFPLGALVIIGWPTYRSWSAVAGASWAAFEERGPLRAVEFLAPAIASVICAGIVLRFRRNVAVDSGAVSPDRSP